MKKYSFRLAQVQRVRTTQEEIARAELSQANREVREAEARIAQRMAAYEAASSFGHSSVTNAVLAKNRYFAELASRAVGVAREQHAQAEREAAEKHLSWMDAATKVKALERLNDRKREEHALESQRAMDAELDDIVVSRHGMGEQ